MQENSFKAYHAKIYSLYLIFYAKISFGVHVIFISCPHTHTISWKGKAGYTATPIVCGWAGAVIEVTRAFEHWADAVSPKTAIMLKQGQVGQ